MNTFLNINAPKTRRSRNLIFFYYLITFFIISFTFHHIFKYNINNRKIVMIVSLIIFFYYQLKVTKNLIIAFIIFSIILWVQGIMFGYVLKSHLISFFFNIVLSFIIINIFPLNYHKYLVNVIYYLSVISLIFWLFSNVSTSFHESIPYIAEKFNLDPIPSDQGYIEQILIFTYEKARNFGILRNAGFCHEPGAFAVILVYAIVFNYYISKNFFNKKGIIFIFSMILTFSSAGYLSLYIILLAFTLTMRKNILILFFYSLALPLIVWFSFSQLNFMQNKIAHHYKVETQKRLDTRTSGRIFAARKALYILKKYPLTGRALTTASIADASTKEHTNYGFPKFASQVGLPVFILCIFLFYKTMKFFGNFYKVENKKIILFSISFIPVLFAQSFLPSLFFNILILYTVFKYKNYGY